MNLIILTPAEMNTLIAQLRGQLEDINTTLLTTISVGTIAARVKRLVAAALAIDAHHTLDQIAESVGLLESADTAANEAPKTGPLDLGEIADAILFYGAIPPAAVEQFGIEPAVMKPVLIEHSHDMLKIVENIVDRVKEKLTEADTAQSLAEQSACLVELET